MSQREKAPVGDCPACDAKGVSLHETKLVEGHAICMRCVSAAWKAHHAEKKEAAGSAPAAPRPKKKAKASTGKPAAPISQPRPAQAAEAGSAPEMREAIELRITCHTIGQVRSVLLAAELARVHVSLGVAP